MNRFIAPLLAIAAFASIGGAKSDVLGSAYLSSSASGDAVIGFSHGAADVTFTVPSPTNAACTGAFAGDTLCFSSDSGYTLGAFLTSSGATVLTGASSLSATLVDTVFEFTGTVTVTTGETFQAGHDDGLQLQIGSLLVIDRPGPTSFTTTPATYTGPSGTFPFDLVYGECCGAPAYLGIALPFVSVIGPTPPTPTPTPEPASLALLGAGLLGLGAVRHRFKASHAKA